MRRPLSGRLPRLWKEQYPARVRRLLEQVQRLKPHVVISDAWYSEEEDQRWWRI